MDIEAFNQGLLAFLQESPTPFHATRNMAQALLEAGFEPLREAEAWSLTPGKGYFVTRNDSSIIGFRQGQDVVATGIRMVGAHTDSPCLRVKPQPEALTQGYFQLGVEVYGGALLNPWFDRDLSLAGRVTYRTAAGNIKSMLVDFRSAIASIPSLAIHLDREANNQHAINAQLHLPPLLSQEKDDSKPDLRALLLLEIQSQDADATAALDYELSFYDTQAPAFIGLRQEFLSGARLDNLLSCYIGLQALLESDSAYSCLLVCNDHEEVGSASACGADGPFLQSVLERICGDTETTTRVIDRSMLISADNAHGIHPNFADRHDGNHGPRLNQGPVIKINANQRYASNSETSALFRHLAEQQGVPVQSFVVRTDMACGSTIGPITASGVGVKTLDIGVPQFGMHSIRETAGAKDAHYLYQVLLAFYACAQVTAG